jgi:predicted NUDIX family NTP pyrophosphohydrolase
MSAKLSAALLLYRETGDFGVEVLIAHPGGPFWAKKDDGAWSIPKGEYIDGEDPWSVALKEFAEEIGQPAPEGERLDLGEEKQPSGKRITCFAVCGDLRVDQVASNRFEMEWPRGSGRIQTFPEVDRADWYTVAQARTKLLKGHVPFLDRLMQALPGRSQGDVPSSTGQVGLF